MRIQKYYLAVIHPVLATKRVTYNIKRFSCDMLASCGYYDYPHRIIFLAGMAMSGSTWMKNLLAGIPGYFTRYTPMPYHIAVNQNICDSAFKHVPKHGYTLFKTHLNPTNENLECIFRNGIVKVLVTYRDLRDVAIARYHRLIEFPKLPDDPFFMDYRLLGQEKAMAHNIELVASIYVNWIRGWIEIARENPGLCHFTKFEDLKKDTKNEFQKVLQFYNVNLLDKQIEEIVEAARGKGNVKKNIAESKLLPWGISSNFRSGKIGSWRQELTDKQIEMVKKLLGPSLIELGYEKDLNW